MSTLRSRMGAASAAVTAAGGSAVGATVAAAGGLHSLLSAAGLDAPASAGESRPSAAESGGGTFQTPLGGGGGAAGAGPGFASQPGGAVAGGVAVSGAAAAVMGVTSVATIVNSGAFTNAVDPVYGSGTYGGGAGAAVAPLVAQPSVFYGGAYGGYGYVPGRTPVRVYLFSECAHPSLAATWSGCYCAVCYIDVSPLALGPSGQRLLNDYGLAANAVAANDIKAAALRSQHLAASQAEQQTLNARLTGLVSAVLSDVRSAQAVLYALQLRGRTQLAGTVYSIHNPAYSAVVEAGLG